MAASLQTTFLTVTKQLYEWFSPSVCDTFFTMFLSSYHHEIGGGYYHSDTEVMSMQKVKVNGQGHRGQNPT